MSIESEILRIQKNIADTYGAVAEMGGDVPLDPTSANLPAAVRSIPAGSGGGDGSPVGTVISYMGKTAPTGYLICDGTVKNVSDYPALAQHIKTQFGSMNYFGGNGTTTFAVPDMRNLFLRGYHGSTTALSGEVGKKQEATRHSGTGAYYAGGHSYILTVEKTYSNAHIDPQSNEDTKGNYIAGTYADAASDESKLPEYYTSRPVNMAVLYCIKAVS